MPEKLLLCPAAARPCIQRCGALAPSTALARSPARSPRSGELDGLLLLAAGDERGLDRLRRATASEDSKAYAFGPPVVNKPSHELFGEELARLNRPAEAEAEFRAALQRHSPRKRTPSLTNASAY